VGCDAVLKSVPVFSQRDFTSPSGMAKPKTLCIFHTVRVKAQPHKVIESISRRSVALGIERFNQAHHPTTLRATVSLVWWGRIGLWLGCWPGLSLVCGVRGSLSFKKLPDPVEQAAMRGAEEAVISDLDKPFGQHMLQEATDELLGGDGTVPGFASVGVFVAKGDLTIGEFHNAVVADSHPQDIRRQVLQGSHPAADRLTMNHPVFAPGLGRDQVE